MEACVRGAGCLMPGSPHSQRAKYLRWIFGALKINISIAKMGK